MNEHRPDARATITTLTAGTLASVAVFAVSFLIRYLGQVSLADGSAIAAALVLLATPAAALVTTSFELRDAQRAAAGLALLVLVVLGIASAIALMSVR